MPGPRISVNLAISADGKISSVERRPSGWTSAADHARLLELRRGADALMVGRGTLAADRMTLTVPDAATAPLRCVVSRTGEISADHPIFARSGGPILILVTGQPAGWESRSDHATRIGGDLGGFLDLLAARHGVNRLHCEGGGMLVGELARLDRIDEFHLTLAGHTLFGGHAAPSATGIPGLGLPAAREFALTAFDPRPDLGECFLSYARRRRAAQCPEPGLSSA